MTKVPTVRPFDADLQDSARSYSVTLDKGVAQAVAKPRRIGSPDPGRQGLNEPFKRFTAETAHRELLERFFGADLPPRHEPFREDPGFPGKRQQRARENASDSAGREQSKAVWHRHGPALMPDEGPTDPWVHADKLPTEPQPIDEGDPLGPRREKAISRAFHEPAPIELAGFQHATESP